MDTQKEYISALALITCFCFVAQLSYLCYYCMYKRFSEYVGYGDDAPPIDEWTRSSQFQQSTQSDYNRMYESACNGDYKPNYPRTYGPENIYDSLAQNPKQEKMECV